MAREATARDAATVATGEAESASRWVVAGIVALGSTSSLVATTVVNVAVSDLQHVFGASLTEVQWVLTGYLLGLSATIPLSGWATDRFGAKRVYLTTLGTFVLASLLCAFAWDIRSEIGFRVLQGLAGGMVLPVGMAILMRMTPAHERGRVMSVLGVPMMLGPAIGPTVGGVLVQAFDWRAIFLVNVPAGLLALVLAWAKMREGPRLENTRFDLVGWLLASPGVALVLYGLTEAATNGWGSVQAVVTLSVAAVVIAAFVVWELRQKAPLLDVRIFANGAYRAAMTVSVLVAASLFGPTFLVPLFQQQVQGYSVLEAGLVIGAQGLGAAAVMVVSGWLTDRIGPRPVVAFGILCITAATVLLTGIDPATSTLQWVLILLLRGVGIGFAMMPAFSSAYTDLRSEQIGRATAISNTMSRVFSSFGIAVLATVLASRLAANGVGSPAVVAQSFSETMWVAVGFLLLALPAALLLKRPPGAGRRADRPPYAAAAVIAVFALGGFVYCVALGFGADPARAVSSLL